MDRNTECSGICGSYRPRYQISREKLIDINVALLHSPEEEDDNHEKETDYDEYTGDGSLDRFGNPARKRKTGGWKSGMLLLVNQGLATLAFVVVEANLVLFSKRVLKQTNAEAANTFSRWIGTNNLFSLLGAFLSDSYLGRYLTCAIFQMVFTLGLAMLSITTQFSLLKPHGCGKEGLICESLSTLEMTTFYVSIYLIALGNGAYEPSLATLGADQFDEEDPNEKRSKVSFFSYFFVALNLGAMFSETVLAYFQNLGKWVMGFWVSTGCAFAAFGLFLSGTLRYRHFKPSGNPISRFSQVIVAAIRKLKLEVPSHGDGLYELQGNSNTNNAERRIHHTDDYKFLDRAAIIAPDELDLILKKSNPPNPWRLCTITQVEEVKCILRLIPIWLCTIMYSAVYIQMLSLFVEQGVAMNTSLHKFHIPPSSMTVFNVMSISAVILFYDKHILSYLTKLTGIIPKESSSELQKMGIGILVAIAAMVTAGLVEQQRLRYAINDGGHELSSLSIFWQIPQYMLVGVSEASMFVAQLEFFTTQIPDSLKSLGVALSMSSTAIGSYVTSLLLTLVMEITTKNGEPGWIPQNLNDGHMDKFFFLSAMMTSVNLGAYIMCAKRYKSISLEKRDTGQKGEEKAGSSF